jgi:hypothetical protein
MTDKLILNKMSDKLDALRAMKESLSTEAYRIICELSIDVRCLQIDALNLPKQSNSKDDGDWVKNPDRSGGAFTKEEIEDSGKWR